MLKRVARYLKGTSDTLCDGAETGWSCGADRILRQRLGPVDSGSQKCHSSGKHPCGRNSAEIVLDATTGDCDPTQFLSSEDGSPSVKELAECATWKHVRCGFGKGLTELETTVPDLADLRISGRRPSQLTVWRSCKLETESTLEKMGRRVLSDCIRSCRTLQVKHARVLEQSDNVQKTSKAQGCLSSVNRSLRTCVRKKFQQKP